MRLFRHNTAVQGFRLALLVVLLSAAASVPAQRWVLYDKTNSELGNTVMAMTSDKKNSKWFGTDMGLARLNGKSWTDFAMFNDKLKGQYVNCLTVDNNGTMWIGTDDYGVIEFDGTKWTEHRDEMIRLQMKYISKIAIDHNDVKWIGVTLGGLVRYDGHDWEKYTSQDSGLPSDFILSVAVDRRNRKWVGTNEGLAIYDDRRWNVFNKKNSSLPDNIVTAVVVDKNDVKWIATLGGLARYDGNEWKVYTQANSPLPNNHVNDIALDAAGAVWMVTDAGVAVFDGTDQWKTYRVGTNKLPEDILRRVMVDGRGGKWFGSSMKGVTFYSAHPVAGTVRDNGGKALPNIKVVCGDISVLSDKNGHYCFDVADGGSATIRIESDGREVEPRERTVADVHGALLKQDFTVSSGLAAKGNSSEKIFVNPFLEQGYITIEMESPVAEVEFVDATGESVRKIPQYKRGAQITISRMPKKNYTLFIRTQKGEKSLKFNLK